MELQPEPEAKGSGSLYQNGQNTKDFELFLPVSQLSQNEWLLLQVLTALSICSVGVPSPTSETASLPRSPFNDHQRRLSAEHSQRFPDLQILTSKIEISPSLSGAQK